MSERFNLILDPWIPCLPRGSSVPVQASLRDALVRAHEFSAVEHPSPIVTLVLHRLLSAFVTAALRGPDRLSSVEQLLDAGALPADVLAEYMDRVGGRFDLFGSTPFMQDPSLSEKFRRDRKQPIDIEELRRETAAPTWPTLFDHTLGGTGLSPAEAAQHLLAYQWFGLDDGRGYRQSPVTAGLSAHLTGESLHQTLVLAGLTYNSRSPIVAARFKDDAPWWELPLGSPSPIPAGWLEYCTRPWRRVLLVRGPDGLVDRAYRTYGPGLDPDWRAGLMDPWVAYVVAGETKPLKLTAERAVWRDGAALVHHFVERPGEERPYARLAQRLGVATDVAVYGVAAKPKNPIDTWRAERLPIGLSVLADSDLASRLQLALTVADHAAGAVEQAVYRAVREQIAPTNEADLVRPRREPLPKLDRATEQRIWRMTKAMAATRSYWPCLDLPFRRFAQSLGKPGDSSQFALEAWGLGVRRAAERAFSEAVLRLERPTRGGPRAVELGAEELIWRLRHALRPLHPEQPATAGGKQHRG